LRRKREDLFVKKRITQNKENNFMKKLFLITIVALSASAIQLHAAQFNCGRILNNWPPELPRATGTTCKLNVEAADAQAAFALCTVNAVDGKNCCVDNAVWKNIKGLAVIQGTNITHIQCPGK